MVRNDVTMHLEFHGSKFFDGTEWFQILFVTLRILGMSWGVKTTCLEAPGVSLGGSGVSIGGVRSLRVGCYHTPNIGSCFYKESSFLGKKGVHQNCQAQLSFAIGILGGSTLSSKLFFQVKRHDIILTGPASCHQIVST